MRVRCPHCQNPIEVLDDDPMVEVDCPSCGSNFGLVGGSSRTTQDYQNRRVGHFELLDVLGVGAFGCVWKAHDDELDRFVAVKIPRREVLSELEKEQFLREARAAAQLSHPNVVSVHEVGRDPSGQLYLVSDFVQGASLSEWLGTKKLSLEDAVQLAIHICDAVQHAHSKGVIHRDLKPQNILMDAKGAPHITDFGLAKRDSGEITMTVDGKILGTPAYMSPEQASGKSHSVDGRSDVYSLGVILFELLTGELPFRGSQQMLLMQILNDDPPSPRTLDYRVPSDLETITLKCLEKEPTRRYGSAQELADELHRYLRGEPIQAQPLGHMARSWRVLKRDSTHIAGAFTIYCALNFALVCAIGLTLKVFGTYATNPQLISRPDWWFVQTLKVAMVGCLSGLGYVVGRDILSGSRQALWWAESICLFYVGGFFVIFGSVLLFGKAPDGGPLKNLDLHMYLFAVFLIGLFLNTLALKNTKLGT